jgi:hypothetical protein
MIEIVAGAIVLLTLICLYQMNIKNEDLEQENDELKVKLKTLTDKLLQHKSNLKGKTK